MSERRKFTDSFGLGDKVSIIREPHGWWDGRIWGRITAISEGTCEVTVESEEWQEDKTFDGVSFQIAHARDIQLIEKATSKVRQAAKKKLSKTERRLKRES